MVRGVIAAGDPQTVWAGGKILQQGGNAVDAAVAAAFAATVAEAVLVNIGGGGLALVVDGRGGRAQVYDFLPAMPTRPPYPEMDFRRILVDFGPEQQPFYIGRASAAVPGLVAGLCTLLQEQGTLPLSTVLQPAIHLAKNGIVLSSSLAYVLRILLPIFTYTPDLAHMFTHNGRPYRVGERLAFPQLGETFERLATEGADLFYKGDIARSIVADQMAHGGLLQAEDLAGYQVRRKRPLEIHYAHMRLLFPPPPSNGGILVAFALRLLQHFPVECLSHNEAEHIRLLAGTMSCTQAARRDWERDARPLPERTQWFLGDAHVRPYRAQLGAFLQGQMNPERVPSPPESPYTTHISVADASGQVVSMTISAGENAGFLVGDTGILLNNMLGEADLHPDGFHLLPPGQRLTTMMTPTVVLEDSQPRLVTGSGGSSRIRSAILQVISNLLDFHMPLAEAVDRPRIHFEDEILQLEGGIPPTVARRLEQEGFTVNLWPDRNLFFGGAHSIAQESGQWTGAGDRRRGGVFALIKS